jgi:hypothetical protein
MGISDSFDHAFGKAETPSDASQVFQESVMMIRVGGKTADNRSEARRTFDSVQEQFEAAKDKPAAMKTLGPKFETAITQSDKQRIAAEAGADKEFKTLQPTLSRATSRRENETIEVAGIINKVADPKERDHLRVKADFYFGLDPKSSQAQNMRADFDKYPGLLTHLDAARDANTQVDKTLARLDALDNKLQVAKVDQVGMRMGYARALDEAGNKPKAEAYRQQALSLLNGFPGLSDDGPKGNEPLPDGYQRLPNAEPWPKPGQIKI